MSLHHPKEPNGDSEEHVSMLDASPKSSSITPLTLVNLRKTLKQQAGLSTSRLSMIGVKWSKELLNILGNLDGMLN